MSEESLITDEARAMVGRESEPTTGYEVSEYEIKQYCYAVDDLNPLYLDKEEAEKGPYSGITAPPLFHSVPFDRAAPLSELREDGLPAAGSGTLTVPLKVTRAMAGGADIEFVRPVRPGDVLTSRRKIADIYERTGRSGTKMVITIYETTFTNQKGEVVVIERSTGIFS